MRITLAVLLAGLLTACSPAGLLNATVPDRATVERDVPYDDGPRRTLDVYRPETAIPNPPLIVFLYGGSWTGGSKAMYPFVAQTLAGRGAVWSCPTTVCIPK